MHLSILRLYCLPLLNVQYQHQHMTACFHTASRLKPENVGVYALRMIGTNWGHTQPVARGDCISSIKMDINTQPVAT